MITLLTIIAGLPLLTWAYLQHPVFGKAPRGKRLEEHKKVP